jgi:hypothetical protein
MGHAQEGRGEEGMYDSKEENSCSGGVKGFYPDAFGERLK